MPRNVSLRCLYTSFNYIYFLINVFPVGAGSTLPEFLDSMVREIVIAFQNLVGNNGWQYVIYTLGVIMGAVFLAVPIYFLINDLVYHIN